MKTLFLITLIIASAICSTALLHQSQSESSLRKIEPGFGGLTGYVYDPDGRPVTNAEVYVEALDDAPFVGIRPRSSTDETGKFFIDNAKPGLNRVYASKEEDGYPDPSFPIYRDPDAPPPEILVREGQITSGVIVRLGQKCEKLLVSVIDAETHSLIKHATITIYPTNNPNIRSSSAPDATGHFEILTPLAPANIRASAEGYGDANNLNVQALLESVRSRDAQSQRVNEITILLRRAK